MVLYTLNSLLIIIFLLLGAVDHRCNSPRGKGIGGTSLINELVYCRGNQEDFNRWAKMLKDPSWRYENVLRYFKKSEDFHKTNPDAVVDWYYHGKGGYLRTTYDLPSSNNYTKIFIEANQELGINLTDYNGKKEEGATILQKHTKQGRRLDQASAFIKPVTKRTNLYVLDSSYVIKIEINNKTNRTTGVLFTKNNSTYRANITKEVIVSAGAIQSPQLLMLSGIGPKEHLQRMNISLIKDLDVGSTLREHVFCGVQFSSKLDVPQKGFTQQIKDYLQGYGPLSAANRIDGAGFYVTKIGEDYNYTDIEIVMSSSTASELGKRFLAYSDETWNAMFNFTINNPFTLTTVLLRSRSVGTIRLNTSNPYDYPLIDFNLLSDAYNKDIETMYEGIQFAINLTKTGAFKRFSPVLAVRPLPACLTHTFLSKQFWYCYIRHISSAAYHPVGTCPTGINPKKGAVVNGNLQVFGVERLRIADASVFPFAFAGQPNAACTMIGEKISDVIKHQHK